ncbi:hypothetical protein ACWV95_09930 [Streptomyces albus]
MTTAPRIPAARLPAYFRSPAQVRVGAVVFDQDKEMVAVARRVAGTEVTVERPSGLTWQVSYRRLRPGTRTHDEAQQLRALAHLHRVQRRGRN